MRSNPFGLAAAALGCIYSDSLGCILSDSNLRLFVCSFVVWRKGMDDWEHLEDIIQEIEGLELE